MPPKGQRGCSELLRAKVPKAKGKVKAKTVQSVAESENYVHFRTADWSNVKAQGPGPFGNQLEVEKIAGHCLVPCGPRIWCMGGDRETSGPTPEKISLLMMDLRYGRWEDHTPSANSYAPSWRWGHSSCMLPAKFPPQNGRKVMLMCGGFDSEAERSKPSGLSL